MSGLVPRLAFLALLMAVLLAAAASAQEAGIDTTRALGEVVVGASAERAGVERVPITGALARDPAVLADVARLAPSAVAPTNSRGETLLTLRGAGERQTAVLLDGAPLTVPWDRRLSLALVPAGVIGSVDVVRGPASLAWGPGATGGALDLAPREPGSAGALVEAEASGGLPARGRAALTYLWRRGPWRTAVAADALASEGDALAAPLPFSQAGGALRTNTDRRTLGATARAAWSPGPTAGAAVTVLHVSAAQGVAPEGHLDPARDRVRFWRLPAWRHTALVARGRGAAGAVRLDGTAWAAAADQTIRQFTDADYQTPDGGQTGRDRTAGARLVASTSGYAGTLRVVAWGLASEHRERDLDAALADRFRHAEWRLGLEAERAVGPVAVLAGAALDGLDPVETAGRASAGAFRALALVARAEVPVGPGRVHAGVARGGRFPTMRELFGAALGRFVLNPGLGPETTWQAEVGGRVERGVEGWATAFARHTTGTIEQEVLPDGRRRRINLGGSRAAGVEGGAAARLGRHVRLDASGTFLWARAWTDTASGLRLAERPGALGRLALTVLPSQGWTWAAEVLATGPAVSPGPDGDVPLPASVLVGGRVGYRWPVAGGLLGAFARVDNAADAVYLPQAGLPAPGREVRVGLRWVGGA